MRRFWPHVTAALFLAWHPGAASAQVQLVPPAPPRWDAVVQLGWTGVDSPESPYADRYEAAAVTGSAGILLTRHLKLQLGASHTGEGSVYLSTARTAPGTIQPYYTFSQHRLRATTLSSSIGYQFFENRWVHPSIAAGVQVAHETHRTEVQGPFIDRPPAVSASTARQTNVYPFVGAGVKFYVAERAFIQTNVDVTLNTRGAQRVTWATGVGFDF